jgi:hypothetical protein
MSSPKAVWRLSEHGVAHFRFPSPKIGLERTEENLRKNPVDLENIWKFHHRNCIFLYK